MALAGIANGGRGVDTTTPQLTRYPLHKHWHGKLAQSRGHWRGGLCYRWPSRRWHSRGDPLMTKVVGTGCALSAVVLPAVRYQAIRWKMSHLPVTGETSRRARSRQKRGARQFCSNFLDALWQLTQEVQA